VYVSEGVYDKDGLLDDDIDCDKSDDTDAKAVGFAE